MGFVYSLSIDFVWPIHVYRVDWKTILKSGKRKARKSDAIDGEMATKRIRADVCIVYYVLSRSLYTTSEC